MSNYNIQLQSNNEDLQMVLQALQNKVIGGEQATPEISINSSNGLITATAGTKSSTHQLAFQPAKTIIPGTASQIAVSSGYYTGGNITVAGDSNLVAGNIKSGISIFGVSGTLQEGGGASSGEQVDYSENEDAMVTRTLSSYFNDRVKSIGSCAFYNCTNLTAVSFPACTTINQNAFQNCTSLTTVNFPACTTIGSYAFQNCTNLTTVSFPACTTIGSYAFQNCTSSLTTVSFPACTTISFWAFNRCYNLKSLYLMGSSLCKLSHSNAFTSTPIGGYSTSAGTYGSIYVPASLLTSYQTATNWTYFSSRFVGIPGEGDESGQR